MVATTLLMEYELDQPTGDSEIDEALGEARKLTGKDWQVVVTKRQENRPFRKAVVVENWQLYARVAGVFPWQVMMCASTKKTVFAYLCGLISGAHCSTHQEGSGHE